MIRQILLKTLFDSEIISRISQVFQLHFLHFLHFLLNRPSPRLFVRLFIILRLSLKSHLFPVRGTAISLWNNFDFSSVQFVLKSKSIENGM